MSGVSVDLSLPDPLTVRRWDSPAAAGPVVFSARDQYVEALWLPTLGPSSTGLLRRLGSMVMVPPHRFNVSLVALSEAVGLGCVAGSNSTLQRSLRRLVRFDLAQFDGDFEVLAMIPPLPDRLLRRLSMGVVHEHDRLMALAAAGRAA